MIFPETFPVVWIGAVAATLTTVCWLPQAIRLIRHKETHAISLSANLLFWTGIACWLVYGLAIRDWPLIIANFISLLLTSVIIAMKLRYG